MEQCAPTLKKLSLELGGTAPFIVLDRCGFFAMQRSKALMISKYRNADKPACAPIGYMCRTRSMMPLAAQSWSRR